MAFTISFLGQNAPVASGSTATEARSNEIVPDSAERDRAAESERADTVPLVFLALLVVGFATAGDRFLWPRRRYGVRLEDAKDELAAAPATAPKLPEKPKAFAGDGRLSELWNQFYRDWQQTRTAAPADYLTSDRIFGHGNSLPNALSGIFTAVGLLGTFVGIAMGLADIDSGAEGVVSPEAISTLVAGMSTAFLTSIAGITLSVWWLFEFRHADRTTSVALDEFLAEADRAYPVEQPHETLTRIRDAVTGMDVEGIAGFGKSIGRDVGKIATDVRSPKAVPPILRRLRGIQTEVGKVERAADRLHDTAEEIKGNVQSLGGDLASALEPLLEKHIGNHLVTLNTEISERQQQALQDMVKSFQDTLVSSVGERLEEFGNALKNASDHQVSAAQELGRFFDRLEEVGKTQTTLLERTGRAVSDFRSGVDGLTEAREAIEQSANAARETMESAKTVMRECRGLVESQEEWSKAHADAMTSLQHDLRHLVQDLAEKVTEFRALSAEKLGEVFATFDAEMAKVTDHLGGTLAEMRDVANELLEMTRTLPGSVGDLRGSVGDLDQAVRDQQTYVGQLVEQLREADARFAGQVATFGDRVDRSLAEVRSAGDRISELAREIREGNEGFKDTASGLVDRMEALGANSDAGGERTVRAITELKEIYGARRDRCRDSCHRD